HRTVESDVDRPFVMTLQFCYQISAWAACSSDGATAARQLHHAGTDGDRHRSVPSPAGKRISFRGGAKPRIAHGENVTPGQVEEAERELTGSGGAAPAAEAAGPGDRAFGFMFSDLQDDEANLLPQSTKSPTTPTLLKRLGRTMVDAGGGAAGDSDIPAIYT